MMQVIPQCPHCQASLPGWHQPVQYGTWQLTTTKQWQKCPVCEGTGGVWKSGGSSNTAKDPCPACKGACVLVSP